MNDHVHSRLDDIDGDIFVEFDLSSAGLALFRALRCQSSRGSYSKFQVETLSLVLLEVAISAQRSTNNNFTMEKRTNNINCNCHLGSSFSISTKIHPCTLSNFRLFELLDMN